MDGCAVDGCERWLEEEIVYCYDCGKDFCSTHYDEHYEECLDNFIESQDDLYPDYE